MRLRRHKGHLSLIVGDEEGDIEIREQPLRENPE